MHKLLVCLLLLSISCLTVQAQDESRKADRILNQYRQQALKQRLAARGMVDKYRRLQPDEFRKNRVMVDRAGRAQQLNGTRYRLLLNERLRQQRSLQNDRQRLYRLYRRGKLS